MKSNRKSGSNHKIMAKSRSQQFITCPHCWTDQRTDRDFCYRCGTVFVYDDERKDEVKEEQAGRVMNAGRPETVK